MYAKWDNTRAWYLAQVLSIKNNRYNVLFMDGYTKDDIPEKEIRVVPKREKSKPMIGKTFYDPGDKEKTEGHGKKFKPGKFLVLCYQPSTPTQTPSYWCERLSGGDGGVKRDIQEFGCSYVSGKVEKGEK